MSTATPATQALKRAGVAFRTIEYDYVAGQDRIGLHAAEAIGVPPERVLKTLMVEVDGKPACAVIPSDRTLSMKRVAAAFGGKSAHMMPPEKAERLTGFHTGGISPFGQKRRVPVAFEDTAAAAEVVINGGRRGLMVALAYADALRVAEGAARPLIAE
ncbi:aminoacyl-tRNA deacylase [Haematobacter massiliensis]|uniref:Cys-tRNA(Pro)/Cys-tRNA(Cys) deacylase n=1 Tax=Haematobacter massiliensis TaxID=195105 RepID=A0A086Y378_9RHOB|nr:aminoacyl-tRNA deacylase [Haematobacter massiliensis]KFI28728.1 prolyl-tRNA synthetase [Haematobacter massiliensis]OWJ69573.1 aminoacyl-tRNA deacylase [Haematobacter massiliensis]OWJ86838.1 aminoacyl-tRNA deacylase [Haematobacter massiliensis]QBJ26269.1 aminoacyl-tRNA deacylase [Haematobacter massiliensis]